MNDTLWLGSQSNYDLISGWELARPSARSSGDDEPELFQRMGTTAVVNITGSLTSGYLPRWAVSYFGVMGYDNIRESVAAAANDSAITGILLNIDSTGGSAMGVEDTANFIKAAGKVKPIVTYNAGNMASAAYWLGSVGKEIIGTSSSINGSIGVKMVHIDKSKAMADMGYKATVIRYGENKALGDPMEPLSEKALAHYNAMAKTLGVIFESAIAENLGMTLEAVQTKFEGGKEFLGADALGLGLLTHIGNFEFALSRVASLAPNTSARQGQAHNRGTQMKTTLETPETALTAEQIAANAAAAEAALQMEASEAAITTEALATLTAEHGAALSAANTQIAGLTSERDAATTALTAAQAQVSQLMVFVTDSIKSMAVALNTQAVTEGDTATVLAEHARISAAYQSKFKIGGSSAVTPAPTAEAPAPVKATAQQNLFSLAAARAATSR